MQKKSVSDSGINPINPASPLRPEKKGQQSLEEAHLNGVALFLCIFFILLGVGLAIYMVLVIAGYAHSGLSKEGRPWVFVGVACLMLAVLVRTVAYWAGGAAWLHGAALLWCAAFGLMAWQMLPVWWSPRTDGKLGCED